MKFVGTFCFLKVLKNWQSVAKICGQCEVSKHLAYRHILKPFVKNLEEKNQKFSFSKLDLSLSVHVQSPDNSGIIVGAGMFLTLLMSKVSKVNDDVKDA